MISQQMEVPSVVQGLGSLPRPESEKVVGHVATSEEESPNTLADRVHSNEGTRSPLEPPVEPPLKTSITRATMRLRIDLADLAENRTRHIKRNCKEAEEICSACQAKNLLAWAQRRAVLLMNVAQRHLFRQDGDALDKVIAELGRLPQKAVEWKNPTPERDIYQLMRRVDAGAGDGRRLASGIVATLSHRVYTKWTKERWDTLVRQNRSPAHYRIGHVLPVRGQSFRLSSRDGVVAATLSLEAGRHEGGHQLRLPIRLRDARQRTVVDKLISGEWRVGELTLMPDRRRPWLWDLRVSYTAPTTAPRGEVIAAINRGLRNALVIVTSNDDVWRCAGGDLEAGMAQFRRRRRSYQNALRSSSRSGKGRVKALRAIEALAGKGERWRQTKCSTIARRAGEWLVSKGVKRLHIDDFTGIRDALEEKLVVAGPRQQKAIWDRIQDFPLYQLQSKLIAVVEEHGIVVQLNPAYWISCRCPECGVIDESYRHLDWWIFKCEKCNFKRELDETAALNNLARGEVLYAGGTWNAAGMPSSKGKRKRTARKSGGNGAKSGGSSTPP